MTSISPSPTTTIVWMISSMPIPLKVNAGRLQAHPDAVDLRVHLLRGSRGVGQHRQPPGTAASTTLPNARLVYICFVLLQRLTSAAVPTTVDS